MVSWSASSCRGDVVAMPDGKHVLSALLLAQGWWSVWAQGARGWHSVLVGELVWASGSSEIDQASPGTGTLVDMVQCGK